MKAEKFFPQIAGWTVLLFCLCLYSPATAQTGCGRGDIGGVTNAGKEFYIVFMQNEESINDTLSPSRYQDIYIAALDSAATVTISCDEFPGIIDVVNLNKAQGQIVSISTLHPENNYIVETSDIISKKAIHIISTTSIVCYGMNHKRLTADAFLALPRNVAQTGSTYRIMSYPNSHAGKLRFSEFAIASFTDSNRITIIPYSSPTMGGKLARIPFAIVLNKGECVQYQSSILSIDSQLIEDVTGTYVQATGPIAVYGGHQRAEVPNPGVFTSRDHLAESIPPLSTWGREFIVASFIDSFAMRNTGGELRIVSGADNNRVTPSIGPPFTLQAGEHKDITINPKTIMSVQTTQPSLLGILANSISQTSSFELGDPFLAIIPPVDQLYTDYSYFVSTDQVYFIDSIFTNSSGELDTIKSSNNYLLVVTEATGVGALVLTAPNGDTTQPIVADYSKTIQLHGSSYAVLWIRQPTPGLWHIHTPNIAARGINILAYGFGYVDSYGYTAGGLYVPHTGIIQVEKNHSAPYPGAPQVPIFHVQNILGDPVYLDSMSITYSSNPQHIRVTGISIPIKGGFGEMQPLEEKTIILTPERPSADPIEGTATIHYRSGLWSDLQPVELNFHIEAGAMAGVEDIPSDAEIHIASNPVHLGSDAILNLSIPQSARTNISIYDALGRLIVVPYDGMLEAGSHPVRVAGRLLKTGAYFYEITIAGRLIRGEFIVTP